MKSAFDKISAGLRDALAFTRGNGAARVHRVCARRDGKGILNDPVGTMECPYCGESTPHHHKPEEIAGMVRGLPERLTALADELGRVDFYSSMRRVYGTDYSRKAEKLLQRDIRQAAEKLTRAAPARPNPGAMQKGDGE